MTTMSWFEDQVKLRKQRDDQSFDNTFLKIARAVTGDHSIGTKYDDDARGNGVINKILEYYRVPKREIPRNLSTVGEKLEYSLHASGVMYRKVELSSGWYRDAFGVMLGFRKADDAPVALIPFGLTHYRAYDEETDRYVLIRKKNEGEYRKEAYAFYRPFPLKRLKLTDLAVYLLRVISPADYVMILLATLLVTLVGMLTPRINLFLFQNVVSSESVALLLVTVLFLLSASIGALMFGAVKNLVTTRIDTKMSICVEAATMMRILTLPAGFFRSYSSGELSSRAGHVNSLCSTLVSVTLSTGLTSVFSLAYISQIFLFAPGLVAPALVLILTTVAFTVLSSLLQMRLTKKQMLLDSKESGMSYATITGIQKIKLTGAEMRTFSRWGDLYARVASLRYNPPLFLKINTVISSAITIIGTIVLYNQAIVCHVSAAEYYAFQSAYGIVFGAFMSLFGVALTAANIKPTFDMAEPILHAVPEISEQKEILTKINGGIEVMNLTFRYSENSPVILDDLSLTIRPGQYVAIVGKTGCGKSTLIRLLLGFETPTRGNIFYDGKDLSTLDLRSLRKNIGVVTQNGKLFQGDIFSNIVIAAPYLTLDDAWEAARIAGIDEDIRRMPMGMHTLISEGSGGISGGQKQRLMIARAVAPKPKLLIMDEATSALDNITQRKVSEALDAMKCTRIVIAHRLSTIRQCDRILVFDGGKVVEDGTYEELIAQKGFFADLVERQRADL